MRDTKFKQIAVWLPAGIVIVAAIALAVHGPIAQFADYHDFADEREWLGIPNAGDVLSNAGFAIVGLWAVLALRHTPRYRLFAWALLLTAVGSTFYHLAPDDDRLVWDRLPIALACAGLLYAFRPVALPAWIVAAVASVAWWSFTQDLRPYILLQAMPLVIIPLWQALDRAPRAERLMFALAIALYVLAKVAELNDAAILDALQVVSGHTLKHLLAAAASAAIVAATLHAAPPGA